MRKETHFSLGR